MAAMYRELDRVEVLHNGYPVALKLQERLDDGPTPYYTVSWRTRYRSGANRRFYHVPTENGCWTIPLEVAADLLERASHKDMLNPVYDDPYMRFGGTGPLIMDSRLLSSVVRDTLLSEIIGYPIEPDWGEEPLFLVAVQVEGGSWRKIMIIDTHHKLCTFRSTTTDSSYRPVIRDQHKGVWYLENSMQDASTATMRAFLNGFRSL